MAICHTHPTGESKRKRKLALSRRDQVDDELQVVDTLGGRMHLRWDREAVATPHGQLVFFAEFLAATGVFERWVSSCPLAYRSGNAPDKRDVLGTLMLGLLAGHRRYAHITALRGDAVAAQALDMNKMVSEDALRRALEHIDEAASTAWLRPALMHSVREALDKPWVLDIDASIKPLYGRQEANFLKPLIANIRAALQHVRATAEQFRSADPWTTLLHRTVFLRALEETRAPLLRSDRAVRCAVHARRPK